jgi:hypothetical protein
MLNYPRIIGDLWKASTSTCANKYIINFEKIGVIIRIQRFFFTKWWRSMANEGAELVLFSPSNKNCYVIT